MVEIVDDSRQALHVKVTAAIFSFPIYITIVYGQHTRERRQDLWEKLGDISLAVEGRPWLVGGDFNIFLTDEERQGSETNRHRDMMEFADAIADCQLIDPGFDGPIFTWHRAGLWERLDRILIGEHWTSVFAATRVTHLARFSSDHALLLVRCQFSVQSTRLAFKFQKMWVRHESFKSEIARVWEGEMGYNGMMNLYNVTNKIITKILASRLAPLFPLVIAPNQSGFIKGRLLSDNALLAQELIHDLGKELSSRGRSPNLALKLDMAKTYDRVQWPFLLKVLEKMGFSPVWVDMISRCISSCWFSVLVNGGPAGFFQSSRRLR